MVVVELADMWITRPVEIRATT